MDETGGLQPVQDGSRGCERLAQHGFRLQPSQLLRRPRAPGRHAADPLERQERELGWMSVCSALPVSAACGRKRIRARPSSRPCSGRKPSAPAACASRSGCSAAGISAPRCSINKDWVKIGYAKGVPMGGDLPKKAGKHRPSSCGRSRTPTTPTSTAFRSSRAGPRAARSSRRSTTWHGPANRKPDPATGKVPAGRQHRRHQEGDLHEHASARSN